MKRKNLVLMSILSSSVLFTACPETDADGDGYTTTDGDCNDSDPNVHPGATELCDGIDNDCNDTIDDGLEKNTYYKDSDNDGYGSATGILEACYMPAGYVANNTDCDDTSSSTNPKAEEICDEMDNNCDTQVDEGLSTTNYYQDLDKDGFGNTEETRSACLQPEGYILIDGDCDDKNANVYPSAEELCDGVDNDCNGETDSGQEVTYYEDLDADGYGLEDSFVLSCFPLDGYSTVSGDCNDEEASVHPNAEELCDGVDSNCDEIEDSTIASYWPDNDSDGFGEEGKEIKYCGQSEGFVTTRGDCNDSDSAIHPGAKDASNDAKDQDCGGTQNKDAHVGLSSDSASSIVTAINSAPSGTTIWVGAGTYNEYNLNFNGKPLKLMSTHGANFTTIDPNKLGTAVRFESGETSSSLLDGFTITNGKSSSGAGGVIIYSSSPTINNCIFKSNERPVTIGSGSPTISNVTISSNSGDGFEITSGSPSIKNAIISKNTSNGVYVTNGTATITNSLIEKNTYNGISVDTAGTIKAYNVRTTSNGSSGIYNVASASTYSNVLVDANQGYGVYLDYSTSSSNCIYPPSTSTLYNSGFTNVVIANNKNYGVFVDYYLCDTYSTSSSLLVGTFTNSIIAYNTSYNIYAKYSATYNGKNMAYIKTEYCDVYNPSGTSSIYNDTLETGSLTVGPAFSSYDISGYPNEFHLLTTSPLVNKGSTSYKDLDGTTADMGVYGGSLGGSWDLDFDTYEDYFWSGTFYDVPSNIDSSTYDCDDSDANVSGC